MPRARAHAREMCNWASSASYVELSHEADSLPPAGVRATCELDAGDCAAGEPFADCVRCELRGAVALRPLAVARAEPCRRRERARVALGAFVEPGAECVLGVPVLVGRGAHRGRGWSPWAR